MQINAGTLNVYENIAPIDVASTRNPKAVHRQAAPDFVNAAWQGQRIEIAIADDAPKKAGVDAITKQVLDRLEAALREAAEEEFKLPSGRSKTRAIEFVQKVAGIGTDGDFRKSISVSPDGEIQFVVDSSGNTRSLIIEIQQDGTFVSVCRAAEGVYTSDRDPDDTKWQSHVRWIETGSK